MLTAVLRDKLNERAVRIYVITEKKYKKKSQINNSGQMSQFFLKVGGEERPKSNMQNK